MREIIGSDGVSRPTLSLSRQTKDALARYCEIRWPIGRRKRVQAEWDLTPDQARAVCEGTPSGTTIDKIWAHPRGGWAVAFPVMAAVIGHEADAFLERKRKAHEDHATRLGAVVHDFRAVAPARPADPDGVDRREGDRRQPQRRGMGQG